MNSLPDPNDPHQTDFVGNDVNNISSDINSGSAGDFLNASNGSEPSQFDDDVERSAYWQRLEETASTYDEDDHSQPTESDDGISPWGGGDQSPSHEDHLEGSQTLISCAVVLHQIKKTVV